ncbi:MAG TPA: outer membrane beta-barrel protein, partial [Pyrinomonadaceae bacterium]
MKALVPFYEYRRNFLLVLSRTDERRNGSWQAVAAVACFVIAFLAGIAGTLFTTGWILNPERHPSLHAIGLVLLILAFPILILGAQCLDLRDRKQNISGNDSLVQEPGKTLRVVIGFIGFLSILSLSTATLKAQQVGPAQTEVSAQSSTEVTNEEDPSAAPSLSKWQYGAFVDLGYLLDLNHPANHLFRSRGTAFRVDSVFLNMSGFYVRKKPTEQSRFGVEATAHAGKDAEVFGFSATAPNIGGYKILRQLGPTNVSYLAPVGKGLTLQAGIFGSLIGYDSLYARDNLNYTRPWGADFTPYFMMGANASYPFSENVMGT